MKSKKIMQMLLALTMGMSLLAGCSSKDAGSGEQKAEVKTTEVKEELPKDTTLKVVLWEGELPAVKKVVEGFEAANPNIKIDLSGYPDKEYETALAVQLAGGSDIDVFATKNNAQYSDLASKGQTLPLDELITKNKFDTSGYGSLYEGLKVNGKISALPFYKTTWVMYYNKDVFDAAGIPYPTDDMTWDEFRETAKKLTKGSGENKTWGAFIHTWPVSTFGPALQTGATVIDEDLSAVQDALKMRLDLEADGSVMSYLDSIATNAHYNATFQKGNVGMLIMGDWAITKYRTDVEEGKMTFNWDIAALPHQQNVSANTSWGMPTSMSINPNTQKQEAAWNFLSYISGQEGAKVLAGEGKVPAFVNDDIAKVYLGDGNKKPDNLKMIMNQKVYVEFPPVVGINTIVNTIYKEEIELALAGEQTVEQAIEKIKTRIKKEV
ncbi:MAG: extracellular solute-binding protein family 1 [Clostridia bacterium]|jgi:multiple sugar transport system substrate-binding protein|nr:extracellular solute-binding protein family 1 [Clostridia bacterium]